MSLRSSFQEAQQATGEPQATLPSSSVCELSGLTALEITSGLVQAVVVTDMLVLNGWHLLPSLLNAAGKREGRHAQFSFLTSGFFASSGTAGLWEQVFSFSGRQCSPGEPNCFLSSLTAGGSLIWQVPLMGVSHTCREEGDRGVECWAPLLGASQLQRAQSSIPSERDGSREHIAYIHKKEIWRI